MATATLDRVPKKRKKSIGKPANFAELLDRLGNISPERIRMDPAPGSATEEDVVKARCAPEKWRFELIDGVLVEKPMGTKEAFWAGLIVYYLWDFLQRHDPGVVLGADGFVRLFPGRIRIPDASFFSWARLPGGELPDEAIASIVPDLAIEVLSKNNTAKEIALKLADYFQSGVQLVWIIDPKTESARIHTAPDEFKVAKKNGILTAADLLPGFGLSLKKLFAAGKKRSRP